MAGSTQGSGQYRTGEVHIVWTARLHRPSVAVTPVLLIHGATGGADDMNTLIGAEEAQMLAERGFVAMVADFGGDNTFGNQDVQDSIDDALDWLSDRFGTHTDQVALAGFSAGAPGALNWAAQDGNAERVAAVAIVVPAVDVAYLHDDDVLGLASEIEDAYGGSASYETNLALYDPALRQADYTPFADRLCAFYSDDDPVIPSSQVTDFAEAVGCDARSLGDVGHAAQNADPHLVVDWLTATIRSA